MGTAQLAGKKEHLFRKIEFSKRFISFKYTLHMPPSMQISTFSKICREVLFVTSFCKCKFYTILLNNASCIEMLISAALLKWLNFKKTFFNSKLNHKKEKRLKQVFHSTGVRAAASYRRGVTCFMKSLTYYRLDSFLWLHLVKIQIKSVEWIFTKSLERYQFYLI